MTRRESLRRALTRREALRYFGAAAGAALAACTQATTTASTAPPSIVAPAATAPPTFAATAAPATPSPTLTPLTTRVPYDAATGLLYDAHSHVERIGAAAQWDLMKKAGLTRWHVIGPFSSSAQVLSALAGFRRANSAAVSLALATPLTALGVIQNFTEETVTYMQERLATGSYDAVKLSLRHRPSEADPPKGVGQPASSPIPLRIYDLAAQRGVPVTLHFEHEYSDELDDVLTRVPKMQLIWAHAGDAQPDKLRALMNKHSGLYADISSRNAIYQRYYPFTEQSLALPDNRTIKPEWRQIFEDLPDRFLFGLDLGTEQERTKTIDEQVRYYRAIFGQLRPATAEKIAVLNAMRLFRKS